MTKTLSVGAGVIATAIVVVAFFVSVPHAFAIVSVTTDPATGITATDATLNGTNGGGAADGHSFWVSLAPFSTASPTIPAGVYSTPDLGAIGATTPFSASLSSITTTGVPSNLPAVTPNTTYYYAAWSEVSGTWYPGAILTFTTAPAGPVFIDANTNGVLDPGEQTFATIQAAVNAASSGQTIIAGAGTYTENVTISKSVILKGPNADIDPNTGVRAAETVIDGGTGFTVKPEATNITINGFTVLAADTGEAIYNVGGDAPDVSGLTISNNIITGGVRAITLESNGDNISIIHNRLQGYNKDLVGGDGTWNTLKINDNYLLKPTDPATDYAWQMGPDGTGPVNGFEFKNNHVYWNTNVGSNITNGTVSGNTFDFVGDLGMQIVLHNSTVSGNTFLGHETTGCFQLFGSQYGLVPSADVTISGNTFTDCGAASPARTFALQLSQDIQHITVTGNTFTNAYDAVNTRIGDGWDFTGKDIHVNNNSITGSRDLGANNTVAGTLDATCNWWGNLNGPGPVGPGTGDGVSANVDFTPWLTTSDIVNGPCDGPFPTLTLEKTVVNDNGGTALDTDWTLSAGGPTPISGTEGSGTVTNAPVTPGTYDLSESGGPSGYTASSYSCVKNGGQPVSGNSITLATGDTAICTITNDDIQPKLTVTKTVVNNNGGTKVIGDFPLFVDATGVASGVQNGFDAGAHTISETNQVGYAGTIGGDCAPNGSITLAPGQVANCTITNDDVAPTLKIVKTVVNDNGGTAVVGNFTLKIDGNAVANNTATPVTIGSHTASEVNLPGYSAGVWGGDCAADGTITLALGENKTCTITNDDNAPSLTLQKTVINDNGGSATASDWTVTATGPTGFSGSGPIVANGPSFDAGTYDLSESGPAGYTASGWVCIGGTTIDGDTVAIGLGQNVLCTITNDDNPPPVPPPPANACNTPLVAPAGYTLVNGTKASDTVTIAPFTMFVGKGGNDTVNGPAAGNYIVCTDKGNDVITLGNGDFTIDAGNGNNTITTGNGTGYITTLQGNDKITTGNGAHTINAGTGNNTIQTGDGNQIVTTGNANDKITTGGGNDIINAGGGVNTVKSGGGNDTVTTGSGNDNIDGGPGVDTCNAGGGINVVVNCAP